MTRIDHFPRGWSPNIGNILGIDGMYIWNFPHYIDNRKILSYVSGIAFILDAYPMRKFGGESKGHFPCSWLVREGSLEHKKARICSQDPKMEMCVQFSNYGVVCQKVFEIDSIIRPIAIRVLTEQNDIGWVKLDTMTVRYIHILSE